MHAVRNNIKAQDHTTTIIIGLCYYYSCAMAHALEQKVEKGSAKPNLDHAYILLYVYVGCYVPMY